MTDRKGWEHLRRDPRRVTAIALLALAALVAGCALFGVHGQLRLIVTMAFALIAPGWSVAAYLPLRTTSLEWAVATGGSFAILMIVSVLMLMLHAWHPGLVYVLLLAATAAVLGHHAVRRPEASGAVAPPGAAAPPTEQVGL